MILGGKVEEGVLISLEPQILGWIPLIYPHVSQGHAISKRENATLAVQSSNLLLITDLLLLYSVETCKADLVFGIIKSRNSDCFL